MPIYEYQCRICQKVSEFILMSSDEMPTLCPYCGGALQKQISGPAIQFKGSGWYITDYARRPTQGAAEKKDSMDLTDSKDSKESKPAEGAATPAADTPSTDSKPEASKKES